MKKEIQTLKRDITDWFINSLEIIVEKLSNPKKYIKEEIRGVYNQTEQYRLIDDSHRLVLEKNHEYEYYDNDGRDIFYIVMYRWETDDEYNKRTDTEKLRQETAKKSAEKRKKTIKQKELEMLKKLKEKYE